MLINQEKDSLSKTEYLFYIYTYQDYIKIEAKSFNITLDDFKQLKEVLYKIFGKENLKNKIILLKVYQPLNSHKALIRYFKSFSKEYSILAVYYYFSHTYIIEVSNNKEIKSSWELTPYSLDSKFHLVHTLFNGN